MVRILFGRVVGNEKGKLSRILIERAYQNFFKCEIKKIEEACNSKRRSLIVKWGEGNLDLPMDEYGLSNPHWEGIHEIAPPFELVEPETIMFDLIAGEESMGNEGKAPMAARPQNNEMTDWKILVYLDRFEVKNENLWVPALSATIEDIVYHELFHTCGDNPMRGRKDG